MNIDCTDCAYDGKTTNGTCPQCGSDTYFHPEGLYPANKTYSDESIYPDTVEKVFVDDPDDGYCDIVLFDDEGNIVGKNNRSLSRIRGALDGIEYGYDVYVYSGDAQ